MNIYKQKQKWKLFLLIGAVLIVLGSLWYTRQLATKISREERNKIKIWAEAIRKKAKLVSYTKELFDKLRIEERKKVQLWADGTRLITNADIDINSLSFILEVIRNNTTVPVIITDQNGNILFHRNVDSAIINNSNLLKVELLEMRHQNKPIEIEVSKQSKQFLYYKDSKLLIELQQTLSDIIESFISEIVVNSASVPVILTDETKKNVLAFGNLDSTKMKDTIYVNKTLNEMKLQNDPIPVNLDNSKVNYVFYKDSLLLAQLKYYPYVQMGIIALFLLIAYSLFSSSRKAEQNQVWVGMSKETAHQLGTPISSLMAWFEYLQSTDTDKNILNEMKKDVERLNTIAERFSKIGSTPQLESVNIYSVLKDVLSYLEKRISNKVSFDFEINQSSVMVLLNVPLFQWVIENIIKNAVDAMEGRGKIIIHVFQEPEKVIIDITDNGRGINKSKQKEVFKPGYTTKKRGWGLGLSLAKRIIEEYHKGKIFVKWSEPGKGTTFRIILNA